MKQLILNPGSGRYQTVEVPAPPKLPGHVLVRVRASVVSPGTEKSAVTFAEKNLAAKAYSRPDLVKQVWKKIERDGLLDAFDAVRTRLDLPAPLGYSCAGEVIGVGEGVSGFSLGDVVACAGGGYAAHAEIAAVPVNLCANLAPFCAEPTAAMIENSAFAALGGIAMHGVRLAAASLGETVAVIGLGLLGQIAVQLLVAAGCRVVAMDIVPERAELARRFGAEAIANTGSEMEGAVARVSAGHGADAVLITAATESDEPLQLAAQIARDRAIVVPVGAVGLNVPRRIFYEKELDLRISRSYGPGRYDAEYEEGGRDYPIGYVRWTENRNMVAFLRLVAEGKLDMQEVITHRFSIQDAAQAYDLLLGKNPGSFLAILLVYSEASSPEDKIEIVSAHTRPAAAAGARIGVIGAGNFAQATLLPILKRTPGVQLVGVATQRGPSGRHSADRYGFSYCTTSEAQIFEDSAINAVFILTRHHLHAAQVVRALDAGKHVFVEKPLALSEQELMEIAEAVSRNPGRLLCVGFNRRFAPLAVAMKDYIVAPSEPIVLHYRVNAGFIPASHWVHDPAQGGGRVLGEACHFIDFSNWIMGQAAQQVRTVGLPDGGHYCGDNVIIQLGYRNGGQAVISYLANGDRGLGKERIEAHAGGRSVVLDDFRVLQLADSGNRRSRRAWLRQDKGHRAECAAFVEAVISGGTSPIPLIDIFATTMATFAAVESVRAGEVIAIPERRWFECTSSPEAVAHE